MAFASTVGSRLQQTTSAGDSSSIDSRQIFHTTALLNPQQNSKIWHHNDKRQVPDWLLWTYSDLWDQEKSCSVYRHKPRDCSTQCITLHQYPADASAKPTNILWIPTFVPHNLQANSIATSYSQPSCFLKGPGSGTSLDYGLSKYIPFRPPPPFLRPGFKGSRTTFPLHYHVIDSTVGKHNGRSANISPEKPS